MFKFFHKFIQYIAKQRRDPRYVFVIVVSTLVFTLCFLQVRSAGLFDSLEKPIFNYFNTLPHALYDFMFAITQMGGLGSLLIWIPLAWYLINRRAAMSVFFTGTAAWALAKVAKAVAHRGRPGELLPHIHFFDGEHLGGYGFPSGHSTFSAAIITVLYYQVPRRYRKYLLLMGLLVGISRMYLGAHFPLDVIGGWALGALVGGLSIMIFGLSAKGVSAVKLKSFLNKKGYNIRNLTFANVDARGSRPVFITTEDGEQYFAKLFGKQEHAADWLFKIFRFFRYKNLQAEEPHMSSRRNVEIEAFAMLWAKQAGVRVADVIDIRSYGSYWISIQQRVDAKQLDEHGHLTQKSLEDAWQQVKKLHTARVAHRDLRAANLMVDKKGDVYLIDFGFAEISAAPHRLHMDTAELLMSMSLVTGVDRAVAAAHKVLDRKDLKAVLPYLQTAVFSGATTKLLKADKQLLSDLKSRIIDTLGVESDIVEADVLRFNRRKLINLTLFAVFVYAIAPQFKTFNVALRHSHLASPGWFLPLAVASLLTYVFTGVTYATLTSIPLKIREASLVQLAASFVSKVVPGGVGGATLNGKYLSRSGLEPLEASAVITAQALIGFLMFIVPLGLFLALNGTNVLKLIHVHARPVIVLSVLGIIIISAAVCTIISKLRVAIIHRITSIVEGLRNSTTPPRELAIAAASSLAVTLAYVFCLYAALQAVGIHIGMSVAVTVYALAVIAKSAIPVPGGLGPIEAAMIGSLVSFGVDKPGAISAVLIYRLATFWIPIPFSLLAYRYLSRKKII